MPVDSFVQVPPDSTGKKIDNSQVTQDGGNVTQRQRVSIGDPTSANALAEVSNTDLADTDYGVAVRLVPKQPDINTIHTLLYQILKVLEEIRDRYR